MRLPAPNDTSGFGWVFPWTEERHLWLENAQPLKGRPSKSSIDQVRRNLDAWFDLDLGPVS